MFTSKLINLRYLSELAGLPHSMLYNYKFKRSGRNNPLSPAIKTKIANAAQRELKEFFDDLGFNISIERKD